MSIFRQRYKISLGAIYHLPKELDSEECRYPIRVAPVSHASVLYVYGRHETGATAEREVVLLPFEASVPPMGAVHRNTTSCTRAPREKTVDPMAINQEAASVESAGA